MFVYGWLALTPYIAFVLLIAFVPVIVWRVISALHRIGKGVEDIAQTLRRIESKGPQSSPLT